MLFNLPFLPAVYGVQFAVHTRDPNSCERAGLELIKSLICELPVALTSTGGAEDQKQCEEGTEDEAEEAIASDGKQHSTGECNHCRYITVHVITGEGASESEILFDLKKKLRRVSPPTATPQLTVTEQGQREVFTSLLASVRPLSAKRLPQEDFRIMDLITQYCIHHLCSACCGHGTPNHNHSERETAQQCRCEGHYALLQDGVTYWVKSGGPAVGDMSIPPSTSAADQQGDHLQRGRRELHGMRWSLSRSYCLPTHSTNEISATSSLTHMAECVELRCQPAVRYIVPLGYGPFAEPFQTAFEQGSVIPLAYHEAASAIVRPLNCRGVHRSPLKEELFGVVFPTLQPVLVCGASKVYPIVDPKTHQILSPTGCVTVGQQQQQQQRVHCHLQELTHRFPTAWSTLPPRIWEPAACPQLHTKHSGEWLYLAYPLPIGVDSEYFDADDCALDGLQHQGTKKGNLDRGAQRTEEAFDVAKYIVPTELVVQHTSLLEGAEFPPHFRSAAQAMETQFCQFLAGIHIAPIGIGAGDKLPLFNIPTQQQSPGQLQGGRERGEAASSSLFSSALQLKQRFAFRPQHLPPGQHACEKIDTVTPSGSVEYIDPPNTEGPTKKGNRRGGRHSDGKQSKGEVPVAGHQRKRGRGADKAAV